MLVLGIETSCDETAAAVVGESGAGVARIRANLVFSQLAEHRPYGGVVPEIAARAHLDRLDGLIAQALAEAGIRFRIVPGITAGIGGLAYVGIPATSRETNQALVLVAGHPAADGEDRVNWEALGALGQPLAIYMGLSRLHEIGPRLIAGGLSPETKLAIVTDATLPSQIVVETTLAAAMDHYKEAHATSPTLVVIGTIVDLRQALLPSLISP